MNKFRAANNNLLLKGLFFETNVLNREQVLYTLKDWDHTVDGKVYPSLYLKYMECNDPSEYSFAIQWLDGFVHWEALCECTWFKEYLARWRKELETRMKSQALARIMAESKSSSKNAFVANKYLLEKGWEPREGSKTNRGRPSKEEVKQAATEIARTNNSVLEDFKRIS